MAITVPSQDLPGVQARGIGAPQIRSVGPDQSGNQLFETAANVANGLAQQSIQKADTAAIMDAESKLSQHKLDLMFNPDGGVYNRKGKDAIDITNQTLPTFDKQAEQIGAGLTNERQRQQFQSIVQNQRAGLNQELNRYEFTQRNQYYDDVDKANIATSADGAVKYADDPKQVAYYQSKGNFVIGQRGERLGLPAEEIQRQQQTFNSGIAVNVIQKMQSMDPLRAQQYYAANYQQMTADDQERVRGTLGVAVANQAGLNIASSLMKSTTLGGAALPHLIEQAESGGDQSAVSPKGATGAMQLMPETAMEVSKQIGVPFDLARLANDKEYNRALGTQYINNMLGRYDGNQTLAVAAYNAGPGIVDDWINGTNKTGKNDSKLKIGDPRTGEISAAEFIDKIPYQETKNYTSKIIGSMAAPTPPRTESFESKYANALQATNNIADPRVKKAAQDALDDYKKANTAQVNATFDQAADYVVKGGLASVPPAILTSLPAEEQLKLQRMDDYQRKGTEPRTDYKKLEGFLTMPSDQLAELSLSKDLQPYLSKSDLSTVQGVWEKAKNGDRTPQQIAAGKEKVVQTTMAMAGIAISGKDENQPKNLAKQQQFRSALQERVDSFALKEKRQPDIKETEDLANQLLLKVKLTDGGWFGDKTQTLWETRPEDLSNTYLNKNQIKLEEIPPTDRREIINVLRANGQQASEANIITQYINRISGLGVKVK